MKVEDQDSKKQMNKNHKLAGIHPANLQILFKCIVSFFICLKMSYSHSIIFLIYSSKPVSQEEQNFYKCLQNTKRSFTKEIWLCSLTCWIKLQLHKCNGNLEYKGLSSYPMDKRRYVYFYQECVRIQYLRTGNAFQQHYCETNIMKICFLLL